MKIVKQEVELLQLTEKPDELIEWCGRTCYKSHKKITPTSAQNFVRAITKRGHHSVIEHAFATFKIITDRGISHEIVRHRLASYSQESTRYCAYRDEIKVIEPPGLDLDQFKVWKKACEQSEQYYLELLRAKHVRAEIARSVLPTCLATELVMTANFREWLHFIKLRSSKAAHPQIREIALKIQTILSDQSVVFQI